MLGDNELGANACVALRDLLACEDTDLTSLSLENNPIDDAALGRTLDMYNISDDGAPLITSAGWCAVFACLRTESSALERLDL